MNGARATVWLALSCCMAGLWFSGCGKDVKSEEARIEIKDLLDQIDKGKTVYAEAGSARFTDADLKTHLNMTPLQRKKELDDPEKRVEMGRFVAKNLLAPAKKAMEMGLDKDPDTLNVVKVAVLSELAKAWRRKAMEKTTVTDEEAREFFEGRHCDFHPGARAKLAQIMFKSGDDSTAREVLARLKNNPGAFADLAGEYSTDVSGKESGGEVGWMACEQMPSEFARLVFTAPLNEIAGPVEDALGLHIVRVEQREEGQAVPFEEVKERIKQTILGRKTAELDQKLIEDLEKEIPVEVKEDLIRKSAAAEKVEVK